MRTWPFLTAVALLSASNGLLYWFSRPELPPVRRPLAELPLRLADRWTGRELGIDARSLEILRLSDYLMRVYTPSESLGTAQAGATPGLQSKQPVVLYVGYYDSQRAGATYHSPKNCLPGAGWQLTDSSSSTLRVPGSADLTVNRVLIEKEFERQLVLYWYQDRGRIVASEYRAKVYLIWDAITRNRTDGSIVRVSTPVASDVEDAFFHAAVFVRDVWPSLREHLPG